MTRRILVFLFLTLMVHVATATAAGHKFTLVIDAGHGGHDAGAVGAKTKEKNLTLRYALAFGKMVENNCPDVNVIYTRKTDRFLELHKRAEIANKQKADLFISVHINALPKGKVARGFQTYTLGRGRKTGSQGFIENLEVAKRENAVILLEKDYKQTYHGYDPNSPESDIIFEFIQDDNMENSVELAKLMQKHVCAATGRQNQGAHQDNLAVLRLTSMPGCLVELGFISTPDEENFMLAESSTEKYARGLFNAFQAYRRRYDKSGTSLKVVAQPPAEEPRQQQSEAQPAPAVPSAPPAQPAPAAQPAQTTQPATTTTPPATTSAPVFKVQFYLSSTRLKEGARQFKGLTGVDSYKEDGMWKYTVGSSTNYNEIYWLRKQVAEKFPQAFIIAFRNGEKMDAGEAYKEYKRNKQR